ncbi:ion-transporting P-type ATPase [Blattamonas nauphoetae]|uniref:Ion-transporting P-type ATPase n=1 Tax=Blattamonas nauphoetae TaxID=2049346 RepID=A0ABQ9YF87_9EUKA|nr:ion-transporting P-type ATPase [Blattamonas nauphoetae]
MFRLIKIFSYKLLRFVFDEEIEEYVPMETQTDISYPTLHDALTHPLSTNSANLLSVLFGKNSIEVPVKPWYRILLEESLNPFFIFQVFSVIVWMFNDYIPYAISILVTSIFSVFTNFMETRSNLKNIHEMSKMNIRVDADRENEGTINLDSTELAPGDIVYLENGLTVPCDIVLLSGQCIVNETMLTGESIPIIKTALPYSTDPGELLDIDADKTHILFGGTKIIAAKSFSEKPVKGYVVRTGFSTAKGRLIRSMLFPKPTSFRFYEDSFKFVGVLFIIALIGFVVVCVMLILDGRKWYVLIMKGLDIITVAVPPALPAAMSIGLTFSQRRLKKKKIFCIDPQRINVCGKIRVMCFDKTGTLTEEGLDVKGVQGVRKRGVDEISISPGLAPSLAMLSPAPNFGRSDTSLEMQTLQPQRRRRRRHRNTKPVAFTSLFESMDTLSEALSKTLTDFSQSWGEEKEQLISKLKSEHLSLMLAGLTSCHSIARIDDEFIGDPLDLKMFEFTKWAMEERDEVAHASRALTNIDRKRSFFSKSKPVTSDSDAMRTSEQQVLLEKLYKKYHVRDDEVELAMQQDEGQQNELTPQTDENGNVSQKWQQEKDRRKEKALIDKLLGIDDDEEDEEESEEDEEDDEEGTDVFCATVFHPPQPDQDNHQQEALHAPNTFFSDDRTKMFRRNSSAYQPLPPDPQTQETSFYTPPPSPTSELTSLMKGVEVGILKRFDFSSHLQRMSVITKTDFRLDAKAAPLFTTIDVFVKGSPEMIKTLCLPSTVPDDYSTTTRLYTQQGYRVIALATRRLGEQTKRKEKRTPAKEGDDEDDSLPMFPNFLISKLTRTDIERDLSFLGLLVLENKLRKQSKITIDELTEARIKSVMVTGDNPLTAVNVAKNCNILNGEETVFIGELKDGEVEWTNMDDDSITLDPNTFLPRPKDIGSVSGRTTPNSFVSHTSMNSFSALSSSQQGDPSMFVALVPHAQHLSSSIPPVPPSPISLSLTPAFGLPNPSMSPLYDINRPSLLSTRPSDKKVIDQGIRRYGLAITGPAFAHLLHQETERIQRVNIRKERLESSDVLATSSLRPLPNYSPSFSRMLYLCRVFARMTPDDKTHLIEHYIEMGFTTGMCGDGANDCGALKAANVGVSLSEVEASIAAPFTSLTANISCVPKLVCEGRAALVTSFQAFKYMALYSLIQFVTVTILLASHSNMSSWQYLFIDVAIVVPLAFTMSYTQPESRISAHSPQSSLISFPVLFTLFFHFGIFLLTQIGVFALTTQQPWYNDEHPVDDEDWSYSISTLYLFTFSQFQYIWSSVVVSLGGEHKKSFVTNWMFMASVVLSVVWSLYAAFTPGDKFSNYIYMYDENKWNQPFGYQLWYRILLLVFNLVSFIVCWLVEYFVVVWDVRKRAKRHIRGKTGALKSKNRIRLASKYQPKMKELSAEEKRQQRLVRRKKRKSGGGYQPAVLHDRAPLTQSPSPSRRDDDQLSIHSQLSERKETESLLSSKQSYNSYASNNMSLHIQSEYGTLNHVDAQAMEARLRDTRIYEDLAGEVVWKGHDTEYVLRWKKPYYAVVWDLIEEHREIRERMNP